MHPIASQRSVIPVRLLQMTQVNEGGGGDAEEDIKSLKGGSSGTGKAGAGTEDPAAATSVEERAGGTGSVERPGIVAPLGPC